MDATTSVDLYAGTRTRLTAAVRTFTPDQLNQQVPGCPEWTIHNLISHLAGGAADLTTGNLEGAPRPPWTAVQVDARRELSTDAVLDEWAETGDALEKLILSGNTSHPFICNPYVDSGTHEADVHGATGIGRPPRDIWLAGLDWMLPDLRPADAAPGTLSIITPDGTYTLGAGAPVTEVHTDTYELFRAVFGRRSAAQIQSWQWSNPDHAAAWSTELPRLPQTLLPLTD
jgi:uncharacterized protein (TIGR03083 family)